MRILILNVDYPGFLLSLYKQNPGIETATYEEQSRARVDSLFGVADFYSSNFAALGHSAWDVHINNEIIQSAWAREHAIAADSSITHGSRSTVLEKARGIGRSPLLRRVKPWLRPIIGRLNGQRALLEILAAQIRHYRPDVILNQAVQWVPDEFLREFKSEVRLIVGQIASPLSPDKKLSSYDLMISSLPNFVSSFRRQGLRSELVRLAFQTTVLDKLPAGGRPIDVSFVGTLSADHESRIELLGRVASCVDLQVWGRVDSPLPSGSLLQRCHRGPAWGIEMYKILQQSRITLNYHIGLAQQYANNLRLFEATGVGALLLTDHKENIHEMFEPGKEVAVYHTPEECAEMSRYYLEHEHEREAIANAGQQRTLRDHTYELRIRELSLLFESYLRTPVAKVSQ